MVYRGLDHISHPHVMRFNVPCKKFMDG